jgi:hypothetical protein
MSNQCDVLIVGAGAAGLSAAQELSASANKSFLYAIETPKEILFYRAKWKDGKLIGTPNVTLRVPFAFPLAFEGNAYDFTRDLSTIIFTEPNMQADVYLLSNN